MPSPAEALYPNGPSSSLGNRKPKTTNLTIHKDASPDEYEQIVDDHIEKNKLQENDLINVQQGDDSKTYKYLGPNSGGRKDWMEVPVDPKTPTS